MMSKTQITRKELYGLVWEHPISYFTKSYILSNSSFKKICLNNNSSVR